MNDAGAQRELIYVLATMAVILIFAVVAVFVFVRVWRKERKK